MLSRETRRIIEEREAADALEARLATTRRRDQLTMRVRLALLASTQPEEVVQAREIELHKLVLQWDSQDRRGD